MRLGLLSDACISSVSPPHRAMLLEPLQGSCELITEVIVLAVCFTFLLTLPFRAHLSQK